MPKPGFITPSRIKDMMTKSHGGKGWGKVALDYARQIALERIGIEIPDNSYGAAIDWGNDHEFQAIQAYEQQMLVEVHSSQEFQYHPAFHKVGGTPDGLVGTNGGMDAKCPYNIVNHMTNILDNAQLKDYELQFQGYMWITGRDWWDFVSFDPRYPSELRLHVHRVKRDDKIIAEIEERYTDFEMIIQGFVDTLIEKAGKIEVVA